MKWYRVSDYCIKSESGYRVSKVIVLGKDSYEAWSPSKKLIGRVSTPDAAKTLCDEHAAKPKEAA